MKYFISVFAFLLLFETACGQTDLEFLRKTKDYINTRYTAFILNNIFIKQSDSLTAINSILKKNNLQQPFTYQDLEVLLQHKYDSVLKYLSAKIDGINITELSALNAFEAVERMNDEAYFISRERFNKAITPEFKKLVYEETASPLDSIKTEQDNTALSAPVAQQVQETGSLLDTIDLVLFTLLFLLTSILVYTIVRMDRLRTQLREARQTVMNLKANRKSEKNKVLPVYNEFRTLVTNKLREYEENILRLQLKIEEQNVVVQQQNFNNLQNRNSEAVNERVLYMGAPSGNYFPMSVQTPNKQNAFYKFILKENGKEASFDVIADDSLLQEAIAHYAFYFEPACFATNRPTASTKKIVTSFPGIAALIDDKWMIKQKAIIVFA